MKSLTLTVIDGEFAVAQLPVESDYYEWLKSSDWFSVTQTDDELSIVCQVSQLPDDFNGKAETGWAMLKLMGPFPFELTGILLAVLKPLADEKIPIFALSTFNTDFVLVKQADLEKVKAILTDAGHIFINDQ